MKALRKEFWMEIRKSKSRFISILLIVALGVAFFSGIQASSPDMRYSGDAYYDESSLMDIKAVSYTHLAVYKRQHTARAQRKSFLTRESNQTQSVFPSVLRKWKT